LIAVDHFGIFCPRHFAISLTKKEAAGSNLSSNGFHGEVVVVEKEYTVRLNKLFRKYIKRLITDSIQLIEIT
jgi:hypothetical protein